MCKLVNVEIIGAVAHRHIDNPIWEWLEAWKKCISRIPIAIGSADKVHADWRLMSEVCWQFQSLQRLVLSLPSGSLRGTRQVKFLFPNGQKGFELELLSPWRQDYLIRFLCRYWYSPLLETYSKIMIPFQNWNDSMGLASGMLLVTCLQSSMKDNTSNFSLWVPSQEIGQAEHQRTGFYIEFGLHFKKEWEFAQVDLRSFNCFVKAQVHRWAYLRT